MLKKLLEAVKGTDLQIPVTLGISLGLRRGEVLGLQWKNINFNTQKIEIRQQINYNEQKKVIELTTLKTENSIRTLPMPKGLVELLLKHKEEQEKIKKLIGTDYIDNDLVCCHNDGRPLNPKNFSKKFKRFLEKNGFPLIRFHDLRHSYATLMLKSNVDLKVTSAMLGHSSVTITADIYQDVIERKKAEIFL
jgi:integrase